VAVCALVALIVAGCGGGASAPGSGTVINVTERDFHISTSISQVSPGDVWLRIHNAGPDNHELIVAPQNSHGLPLRGDGFTLDEDKFQNSEPGSVEPQLPNGTKYLKLHLAPGRYVLFCNMEGHYMSGMHTELVVR
jgi:uncharacterized cupredoxin-like copper-binding protein